MITYKVVVNDHGTIRWYNEKGQPHREDGPACEYSDGSKSWYLNGMAMTKEEHARGTSPVKELSVSQIENLLGYSVKIIKE